MIKKSLKVFVAMSGGVDSSVAAALLKKRGFDVSGIFMKFWSMPRNISEIPRIRNFRGLQRSISGISRVENKCCSAEAYYDASRVADKLGIRLYTFNFEDEFKKRVVGYFIRSLKQNITPNPCVICNKEIKFGLLLKKITKLGGDYVATGHYVKKSKIHIKDKKSKNGGNYRLLKAKDKMKDQSYFLWTIKQKQLAKFLFPIGDYKKSEIRKIAEDLGLPVFQKRDSEDLCFVGDHSGGFIDEYIKPKAGDIIDVSGNILGIHKGLAFYTIGQRKNIELSGGPWYVREKDSYGNCLVVVNEKDKKMIFSDECQIKNINWISGATPEFPIEVMVKIRYQHKGGEAIVKKKGGNIFVKFKNPQLAITSGQSAVFYKKDELLGGGIIEA